MGRNSIASADVIRLPLPDGDYITVKKELNAGESIDVEAEVKRGDNILAPVIAYLVGWSLVGSDNTPIPYSPIQSPDERRATLRALTISRMKEIVAVLEPHLLAMTAETEEKKTTPPVEVGS